MRYSKGKWKASRKDIYWGTCISLDKIIFAHIEALYKALKESDCHGVPMSYVAKQAKLDGLENSYEGDATKADQLRIKDLEELLWVFSDNEPDIRNYKFTYDFTTPKLVCSNPSEADRYTKDMHEWQDRKGAGYKLFGEIYNTLDI